MKAFLDTHAALFLHDGDIQLFGSQSRRLLESSPLLLSPVVRLEMTLLSQVGRMVLPPDHVIARLLSEHGVLLVDDSTAALVEFAAPLIWTRDPFDRLIVANAALHEAPLLTRDRRILEHYGAAVW